MTVGEYIEELKKLDRGKNIWVFYDYPYSAFPPMPDTVASKEAEEVYSKNGVKEGDYVITAG